MLKTSRAYCRSMSLSVCRWHARNVTWSGPVDVSRILSTLTDYFTDVSHWCAAKRYSWMPARLKFFGLDLQPTCKRFHQARASCALIPVPSTQQVSCVALELWLTPSYQHVSRVAQVCFFHLRPLRPMRARLGRDVTLTLVTSLVLSRLDYCNSVLAGLRASPQYCMAPLQSPSCSCSTSERSAPARSRVADTQGTALAADQATGRLQTVPPAS